MISNPTAKKISLRFRRLFRHDRWFIVLLSSAIILTFSFVVYPLFKVFQESYSVGGEFSLERYVRLLQDSSVLAVLRNSLLLGVSAGLLSTLLGFAYAYVLSRPKVPFRRGLELLALLPIVTPPFSIGIAAILLFGRAGLITFKLLGIRTGAFYGFPGLLMVQSLSLAPVAYLVLVGMLRGINPFLEEAAHNMGASSWQIFRTVTWPLMRPGLANAFLLSFITSLADFGNPMVIGGNFRVLAPTIYFYIVGRYDFGSAATLSVILLVPTLGAFLLQKFWIGKKQYITVTGKPSSRLGASTCPPVMWVCSAVTVLWSITIIVFYAAVIAGGLVRTWGFDFTFSLQHYAFLWQVGFRALWNTLLLSVVATPLAAIFGLIVAYLTVRKTFFLRRALEFSTILSFAVPGTVMGIGYVLAFNSGWIVLTGTASIIVIALVFRNMSVSIRSGVASLQQVDHSMEEAAINMGANTGKVLSSIIFPLIKSSFLAGMIYSFVRAMTAISSIIFLVSPQWPLVVPTILNLLDGARLGAAAAYSTIMIVLIVAVIAILNRLMGNEDFSRSIHS